MTVAYHGAGFHGFAAQPGQRTVAGVLAGAIETVLRHPVVLTCAGRTDRGVHAWGQVVSFEAMPVRPLGAPPPSSSAWRGPNPAAAVGVPDLAVLARSVNKLLHAEVVVRAVEVAEPDFDARRSATGRSYRYTVLNRSEPDPFLATTAWQVEAPLDLRAMQLACDPLIGEHDFSSFCRRPPDPDAQLVRRVRRAEWRDLGEGLLRFDIEASAFCHQMVRSLVGTLVDVGLGRKKAGDMAWILRSCDRALAGSPAPPHGLCLWGVSYGELQYPAPS
jgi:tRNA pseudouridine38-40 synthase